MATPQTITVVALERQYQALRQEASTLAARLTPEQAVTRPAPGRWSVGECLAHLTLTSELYRPALVAAIDQASTTGSREDRRHTPYTLGWLARRMISSMEPPPRMRLKAPRAFRPVDAAHEEASPGSWAETLETYDDSRAHYLELLARAHNLDLARRRIASPVSRWIQMRVVTAFAFLAAHDRRHLWQASRVAEDVTRPMPG